MKRILVTGVNSFIGSSFEKWCHRFPGEYEVTMINLRGEQVDRMDFRGYDSVFHIAGIAHVSADKAMKDKYYKVNRDLAIMTAKRAKADNVKHFVFMSSINVYGKSLEPMDNGKITIDTIPIPRNFYGDSKLQAEIGLKSLADEDFKIAILRPPMVYGKGAKGNYPKLVKFALMVPFFPDYQNQRSMIHIDNLCEFIRLIISDEAYGTFFPQNAEYSCTSNMVAWIVEAHGKKVQMTKIFNPLIRIMVKHSDIINRVFGSLAYDFAMSQYPQNYQLLSLKESVFITEKPNVEQ